MRFTVAGLLLLSGCGSLGLQSGTGVESIAGHSPIGTISFAPPPIVEALDDRPRKALLRAERDALRAPPPGEAFPWAVDDVHGRVEAGPLYMVNARTCRSIVHVAQKGERRIRGATTVCQAAGGGWEEVG